MPLCAQVLGDGLQLRHLDEGRERVFGCAQGGKAERSGGGQSIGACALIVTGFEHIW